MKQLLEFVVKHKLKRTENKNIKGTVSDLFCFLAGYTIDYINSHSSKHLLTLLTFSSWCNIRDGIDTITGLDDDVKKLKEFVINHANTKLSDCNVNTENGKWGYTTEFTIDNVIFQMDINKDIIKLFDEFE